MTLPTFFISHGGGPWPWIDERRQDFAGTFGFLQQLPATLPEKPRAILSVSGHWEEPEFTVATAAHPPMVYDYYGFPEHTYRIKYPAPGAPELAKRVQGLLSGAGIRAAEDAERGFDHGTFVPLAVMYPDASVPILSLSLRTSLNAADHIRMGEVLQPLRAEGVLIVGSGLSYHNLSALRSSAIAGPVAEQFEAWLTRAVEDPDFETRNELLTSWTEAPVARQAHPREEHLIPLMVAAGAAGQSRGHIAFRDYVWGVSMASYRFN